MTTSQQPGSAADQASPAGPAAALSPRTGLSELVVPGVLVAIAIFLIIGTMNMKLPPSVQVPGPTFFPMIVIGLLLLMALLSTVQILRNRSQVLREARNHVSHAASTQTSGFDDVDSASDLVPSDGPALDADGDVVVEIPPDVPPGREPWPAGAVSDWRALGIVLASLAACIVLLNPAGWIIAAAVLFWGVSYALGSRRPVFDVSVALVMSSLIQLIFGAALGLNLPAGFLEGVL
jgi:putative tricarboxylic transport membrane protein